MTNSRNHQGDSEERISRDYCNEYCCRMGGLSSRVLRTEGLWNFLKWNLGFPVKRYWERYSKEESGGERYSPKAQEKIRRVDEIAEIFNTDLLILKNLMQEELKS